MLKNRACYKDVAAEALPVTGANAFIGHKGIEELKMAACRSKIFPLDNGLELDVRVDIPEKPRFCVVVWPCMGGAAQMYKMPVERFVKSGSACILYNPRGHGKSAGEMEIPNALADLKIILDRFIPPEIPLLLVGHSAGANAVLQFGARFRAPRSYLLVAPVLDSRESLFFMYRKHTIREFIDILCALADDDSVVRAVLADEQWLVEDRWRKEGYREILDGVWSRARIGTFLERLFIPGHNAFAELAENSNRCLILTAKEDSWYPAETISRLAAAHNIRMKNIAEAQNHFFAGGWDRVWDEAMNLTAAGKAE